MTDTIDRRQLLTEARAVLAANDMGEWTRPTKNGLYPHQWLWDSFFIAIGQRHYNVDRAMAEARSPFRAQWKNGMLPHIIFEGGPGYHAGPELWHCEESPDAPDGISTSGVTQPAVGAEATVQIGALLSPAERRVWYQEMYPRLLTYHQWYYRERDLDNDGLVTSVLSWEPGLDNIPPWMLIMHKQALSERVQQLKDQGSDKALETSRKDTKAVPAAERISTIDLHAVYDLITQLRNLGYDYQRIAQHHPLKISDLTLNCVLMRANEHLRMMAKEIGEELPRDIRDAIAQAPQALELLWDEETGQYYNRDEISGNLVKERSIDSFLPLYALTLPPERVARLVEQMRDPEQYGLAYPIPSTPKNSSYFNPHRYWQGPSWMNMNWLIINGLRRNGEAELANHIRRRSIEMVAKSGMYEYFSPIDATKAGSGAFGWTAALLIDMLAEDGIRLLREDGRQP